MFNDLLSERVLAYRTRLLKDFKAELHKIEESDLVSAKLDNLD